MPLTHDSLWKKSNMLIDRALAARDAQEDGEFYL